MATSKKIRSAHDSSLQYRKFKDLLLYPCKHKASCSNCCYVPSNFIQPHQIGKMQIFLKLHAISGTTKCALYNEYFIPTFSNEITILICLISSSKQYCFSEEPHHWSGYLNCVSCKVPHQYKIPGFQVENTLLKGLIYRVNLCVLCWKVCFRISLAL